MPSSQYAESLHATITFESTKAQEWNYMQADQIHWERNASYRNQNYRHLHNALSKQSDCNLSNSSLGGGRLAPQLLVRLGGGARQLTWPKQSPWTRQ
jgi:hypothetical protein